MVLMPRERSARDERGAVAIVVALMALALFGVAALVVDLGYARTEKRAAQNTADASALAAGNVLFTCPAASAATCSPSNAPPNYTAAVQAAKAYALKNGGVTAAEWTTCTDTSKLPTTFGTQCISFQVTPSVARIRVKVPTRDLDTAFAKAIGVDQVQVSAFARSTLKRGGASECGLCILGSNTLHDVQNGDVTVQGAGIHFNGSVSVSTNGLIATGAGAAITVQGTASGPLSQYIPDPTTGVPAIIDPLADYLAQPAGISSMTTKTNPCTQGPGKYSGYNFPNSLCTLQPGTYVITGQWAFSGNAGLAGTGVTLFFTCGTTTTPTACNAPGQAGGWLDFSGNGAMTITAPLTGPYQGMAIWYDRLNTSDLRATGNGAQTYSGTIYASSAKYRFNGNGCAQALRALIIVKTLELNGTNACLTSNYTQSTNTQIPPGALHLDR